VTRTETKKEASKWVDVCRIRPCVDHCYIGGCGEHSVRRCGIRGYPIGRRVPFEGASSLVPLTID
jgi:hypothetical protein